MERSNILVCVKAVPDLSEVGVDEKTGMAVRQGIPCTINPLDAGALEMALRIKDELADVKVFVLSMGPERTAGLLQECLAAGADGAYLLSGGMLGGSDTLATSYALSCAVRYLSAKVGKVDLILCGKKSADGETAQVGPELAEHLCVPQITGVLDMVWGPGRIEARRETDEGYEIVSTPRPCLVTTAKLGYGLRCPTVKNRIAARRAEVSPLDPQNLGIDCSRVGLRGSPTKVKHIMIPEFSRKSVVFQGESSETAEKLLEILRWAGVFGGKA